MKLRSNLLLGKITRGLERDRDLPLQERVRKGGRLLADTLSARLQLRLCDEVGSGARVTGRVRVVNEGTIRIGTGLALTGPFIPVEFLALDGGQITLGDDAWVNFGCVISARARITIGARCQLGQHCVIADSDHPEGELGAAEAKPIEIGDDVWLAGRVTVRPGVHIGARSVITAGSIVEGDIPAGVIAGGIPARVIRRLDDGADVTVELTGATVAPPAARAAPISAPPTRFGTLVSDFTIDELAEELRSPGLRPPASAMVAPFGQVAQTLMSPADPAHADFLVVWVLAEGVAPSFASVARHEQVDEAQLLAEVDAFCALVGNAAAHYKTVFVPTVSSEAWRRGLGLIDVRPGGVARARMAINARLADNLAKHNNVYVLDADRWLHSVGHQRETDKAWYMGKLAMPRGVVAEAAADIRAALAGLAGEARKLLVLDLDDTLWGGIVGDVGWEGLRLGGPDAEGESFSAFQHAIKALKRRGVVLALASKNEESVALTAIREHPEMVLREADFVAHRINWFDKAQNIAAIASELNLGLQSVVFIDDNPVERARVREALPEVFVPEWPVEKFHYVAALHRLSVFDAPSLSEEDLARTRMYQEERQRDVLQQQVGSVEDWLLSLQIRVVAEPLHAGNLTRATQLLNKTNQLNLSTRRLTENELLEFSRQPAHAFWAVSVSDRFGDAGLTGLLSLVFDDAGKATILDYVLSCRVMGRRVEETMVHMAVSAARERARTLSATLLPTAKNKPCLTFWQGSGFSQSPELTFSWDLAEDYALPNVIQLDWKR